MQADQDQPALRHVLVSGGAGFIGSAFARNFVRDHPEARVTVLDKLTYAGNTQNLAPVWDEPRFRFVQADICDYDAVAPLVVEADTVVNFAAESHVDRSIMDPDVFVRTNVLGVNTLLRAARDGWKAGGYAGKRFLQVSTDEVYGHVGEGATAEDAPLAPRNPYSASKAGAELMVFSYGTNFGLPVVVTRGENTIGPYQYPEKATPLFITNAIEDKPLPIYGQGRAVRHYVYVDDHAAAIDLVLRRGAPGEAYNIGNDVEVNTVRLAETILDLLGKPRSLMQLVPDRPGHDYRYNLDYRKTLALGWQPQYADFEKTIGATVAWYRDNQDWWRTIKAGEYQEYYKKQYAVLAGA
ncbi:MAG: dTDP-glucose 4,6-dehydratase [uncultured Chloroflexi bacterium]|uniref:dTDP-glucose 4,6-dehydratase n=1 Tax=uncultured Chloroflexota bacterium TaxID=166587 RepID=A0A6J4I6Q8_9CHLR|nr:MAG: dTDP-glucose 4,6-dehydratase [uncultured Chloroflexota bacterium]